MKAVSHKRICAGLARRSMRLMSAIVITGSVVGSVSIGLIGCSTTPFRSQKSDDAKRIDRLERELRQKQSRLQELKERNLVLERRVQRSAAPAQQEDEKAGTSIAQVPIPFHPSAARDSDSSSSAVDASIQPQMKPTVKSVHGAAKPVLQSVGDAQTGEHFLYSKVLESYRKQNVSEIQKSVQLLMKTYPDSVFADNALYLAGLLALEKNDTARARQYMDRVLKSYPKGNKAVSALFAKGIIEKRDMNFEAAKNLFERVRKTFPGSPEAARVSLELKLLKMTTSPRRGA